MIELKHWVGGSSLKESLEILSKGLKKYQDRGIVYLQSFNPAIIRYKNEIDKDMPTGLLVPPCSNLLHPIYTKIINDYSYDFLALGKEMPSYQLVKNFRDKSNNNTVLGWGVKNEKQENKIKEKFADNIVFEDYKPKIKIK